MSVPMTIGGARPADRFPAWKLFLARLAVFFARLACWSLSPGALHRLMAALAKRARPASGHQAMQADALVAAVSPLCAGMYGCLPRSVAAAALCRAGGVWPTWTIGVRESPPFGAHAWIDAGPSTQDSSSAHVPLIRVGAGRR